MVGPPSIKKMGGGFFMKALFISSLKQDQERVKTVLDAWRSSGHRALSPDGPESIGRLVSEADVAIVLIDQLTSDDELVRRWVRAAHEARRPMLAIHVHNLPGADGLKSQIGNNRFGPLEKDRFFWQIYPTYRWVIDNGGEHLEDWVEKAIQESEPNKGRS